MILFFVLSLGFYGLYWMHQVHKQYQKEFGKKYDPTLRTLGLFVPFYNLVVWKLCQLSENVVDDQDGTNLFILWILVAPIAVYLIQSGINSKVEDAV
ncbi:hypothetical protein [Haladaptatus sp. NG-WS-4]